MSQIARLNDRTLTMHCECEHDSHFATMDRVVHSYGHAYVETIPTWIYGPFTLCQPCLDSGHMGKEAGQ